MDIQLGIKKHKGVLVISNYGIGNFIMILPVLASIKRLQPHLKMYCLENEVMKMTPLLNKAGLHKIDGLVPSLWRRFLPENNPRMFRFMAENSIRWVLNFRLEAPELDGNYFSFKDEASKKGIECWDLYDSDIAVSQIPAPKMIQKMLNLRGVEIDDIGRPWINNGRNPALHVSTRRRAIGIFLGASRKIKRWHASSWIRLIDMALSEFDHDIHIYAGTSPDEIRYAQDIFTASQIKGPGRVTFIARRPLDEVLGSLAGLSLLVSHDTFASHVAAAARVPAIILYTATNSSIWAPVSQKTVITLQSASALKCREMKIDGTCKNYYKQCNGQCKNDIDTAQVYNAMKEIVKENEN